MKFLFLSLFLAACSPDEYLVPKRRAWQESNPVILSCPGVDEAFVKKGLSLVPINMDYIGESEGCFCSSEEPNDIPYGIVEVFHGTLPSSVAGKTIINYDSDGVITGACISVPIKKWNIRNSTLNLIYAHELSHACGYDHALDKKTNESAWWHIMSEAIEVQGKKSEGMNLDCDQADL